VIPFELLEVGEHEDAYTVVGTQLVDSVLEPVENVGEQEDAYIVVCVIEGHIEGFELVVAVQSFVKVVETVTIIKTSDVIVLAGGQVEAVQLLPVVTVEIGG